MPLSLPRPEPTFCILYLCAPLPGRRTDASLYRCIGNRRNGLPYPIVQFCNTDNLPFVTGNKSIPDRALGEAVIDNSPVRSTGRTRTGGYQFVGSSGRGSDGIEEIALEMILGNELSRQGSPEP